MKKLMTKKVVALALVLMMLVTTCISYTASAANLTITVSPVDSTIFDASADASVLTDGVKEGGYNTGLTVITQGSDKWTNYDLAFDSATTIDTIVVYGGSPAGGGSWNLPDAAERYVLTVNGATVPTTVSVDRSADIYVVVTIKFAATEMTNATLAIQQDKYRAPIYEIEALEAVVETPSEVPTETPSEVPSEVEPSAPAADAEFELDIEAPANAVAGDVIDVVITAKNIKQELNAIEFFLDFDETKVAGVITESGDAMNAFITVCPQYIASMFGNEGPMPRYEQICKYEEETGGYQCRFIDNLQYAAEKPGQTYQGLINDGDLVITIQFKVLEDVADGDEIVFATVEGSVKGTTRETVTGVVGSADSAKTIVGNPVVPPVSSDDPVVSDDPTVEPESSVVEPESSAVEPESSVVEPESSVVEPESSVVEPESSVVEPESSVVEPESSVVEPESSVVEPESSVVEPESSVVEPESSVVEPESSEAEPESSIEVPEDAEFVLDIEAPATAEVGDIIDVVITAKNIKQELDAIEFVLTFDPTKVAGVITENGDAMNAFITVCPQYIASMFGNEGPMPRYEQICRYDAEKGVYECRFIDNLQYAAEKPGQTYGGLINDGDLVITIQFKVLEGAQDSEIVFATEEGSVKGTTRATVTGVVGFADSAKTIVGNPVVPPVSSDDPVSSDAPVSSDEPTTSEPATSEPATSEPATSEPATSEPATSEPATSEPAASDEPATSEPAESEDPGEDVESSENAPDASEEDPAKPGDAGFVAFVALAVLALAALVVVKKARRA